MAEWFKRTSHKRVYVGSSPTLGNMTIKSGEIFFYGAAKLPGIVLETRNDGTAHVYEIRDRTGVYAGGATGHFSNFRAKDQKEARKTFIRAFFGK